MPDEQPDEAAHPERKRGWVHDEDLLRDELQRAENDVFVAARDVAQELKRGPIVADLPKEVRKREGERYEAAEPDSALREVAAFGGQEEGDDDAGAEEDEGVFVLEAKAGDDAEEEPEAVES